ncbi:MAG: DUF6519 domain-containing protein [Myxococcota bacterium]
MKTYISRSRFDATRRDTGVFQQMGRPVLDADWNEEVHLRTRDTRDRGGDVVHGSPDDGFRVGDLFLLDPVGRTGWQGDGLAADDDRLIRSELRLDRREHAGLPYVLLVHGHRGVRRTFAARDLDTIAPGFPIRRLVLFVRFERPPADDELTDVQVWLRAEGGAAVTVPTGLVSLERRWTRIEVNLATAGLPSRRLTGWGLTGLPPRARVWIDGLRGVAPALGTGDFVVGGGDGTTPGRIYVDGVRAWNDGDLRYLDQPDLPGAAALPDLAPARAHFVFLDVWERAVTALDDPGILEPAMEGLDTTTRLRLVQQVRVRTNVAVDDATPPSAVGDGRLTTNVPMGMAERYGVEHFNPCRDRCLFTETASVGEGYRGSEHLFVRVEVLVGGPAPVIAWARDNGATVFPLVETSAAGADRVVVQMGDAARLRPGDLVVVEDEWTRRDPGGAHPAVLRRVRSVEAGTGAVIFDGPGSLLATDPALDAGGALPWEASPTRRAALRRWDGADRLKTGVCYNLPDGLRFALRGTDFRPGEYWCFTVRIHLADGTSRGVVETLTDRAVMGPVHHAVPLARITPGADGTRVFEDLRPRWMPLADVRDRLIELETEEHGKGPFTVVVGDGRFSHGDVDQLLDEGVTGDEALAEALRLLRLRIDGQEAPADAGGTIYIRRGRYRLEHPVVIAGLKHVRILGEGEGTELLVTGAGGAFYLDQCEDVRVESLRMVEDPSEVTRIGRAQSEPSATGARPLDPGDVGGGDAEPDLLDEVATLLPTVYAGKGRASARVLATYQQLRQLQRRFPGQNLESVAEAAPLLAALAALPHGVITLCDSRAVRIEDCALVTRSASPAGIGLLATGSIEDASVTGCRIRARVGVAALPYAPFLTRAALRVAPLAGLRVDGLRVTRSTLDGLGDATAGVILTEGSASSVEISENTVEGFLLGIGVVERAVAGVRLRERSRVADNRVRGASLAGIQVSGAGVDVVGNDVNMAAARGPLLAGIVVAGSEIAVLGNRVKLVASPTSPFGLRAAVLVGDGLDDGDPGPSVDAVEVNGNDLSGVGAASLDIGIAVGGPQVIRGVRICDNRVRKLGDAAVRVLGTSAAAGELVIADNVIEDVARAPFADGGLSRESVLAELAEVDAELSRRLAATPDATDLSRSHALLGAIVALGGSVRGGLDGALRRAELQTLRAAIAVCRADGVQVWGNQVDGVGSPLASAAVEVRTAGIATCACTEVEIAENRVSRVVAPVTRLPVRPPVVSRLAIRSLLAPVDDPASGAGPLASKRLAGLGAWILRRLDEPATREEVTQYRARLELAAQGAGTDAATLTAAKATVDLNAEHVINRSGGANPAGALHLMARDLGLVARKSTLDSDEVGATEVLLETMTAALEPGIADAPASARRVLDGAAATRLLSVSVRETLKATSTREELLGGLRARLEDMAAASATDLAESLRLDARGRFSPAHGVLVVGGGASVRITRNVIDQVVNGVATAGGTAHALGGGSTEGGHLDILDNQVRGAVLTGIEAVTDGNSQVTLAQNQVQGSGGEGGAGLLEGPQAMLRARGSGQLVVQGNRSQGNGNDTPGSLLHEAHLEWRGDLTVTGNVLRHGGGGGGGAALVLVLETPGSATLVERLCRAAFLTVEPVKAAMPAKPEVAGPTHDVELGGFKQIIGSGQAINRSLRVSPSIKAAPARAYTFDTALVRPGLLDFVRRPLPIIRFSPPPAWRSIHIEGNDLSSPGPALLALGEGADVLSTTVTGNSLRSEGRTGAAYLRHTDATVFVGNRCQAGNAVNVVLIVADDAPVTASANVILGAEPVAAPVRPMRPSNVSVGVPLADGTTVSVPLHPKELAEVLGVIRQPLVQYTLPTGGAGGAGPGSPTPSGSMVFIPLLAKASETATAGAPAPRENKLASLFLARDQPVSKLSTVLTRGLAGSAGRAVESASSASGTPPTTPTGTPTPSAPAAADALAAILTRIESSGPALATVSGASAARYSLVVVGGTKVAAMGNATTAGVLVVGADGSVELNP